MSKINSLAAKPLNAAAPEADNGIKAGISLNRAPAGCRPHAHRDARGHELLGKVQRSPRSLARLPGPYAIPGFPGALFPQGGEQGRRRGLRGCPQGG